MSHAEPLVFDAHVDSLQKSLDLGQDLGLEGPGHLDLERAAAGGLGSVVFVCWCHPSHIEKGPHGARDRTRGLLGEFHRLIARHPERVRFAGNGAALRAAHAAGCVGGIPGIEGGHSIEESLEQLEWFFERGVRVMGLVWNNHLSWIRSCQPGAGANVPAGMNAFGREVVRRMNELGMLVDLSHAGERSFYDALEAGAQPAIASHSGCKSLHDHPRNLTDEQLRELARHGGVVGIVFYPTFLSAEAQAEDVRLRKSEAYRSLCVGLGETEAWLRRSEWLQREARPLDADVVIDHICHAVEIAGVDHVGLGSDYDGIERAPRGLEHAGCYGLIAERLRARGFHGADVAKILGGNMQRVFERATAQGTRAWEAELQPLAWPGRVEG